MAIIDRLKKEHRLLKSILADISRSDMYSAGRKELFTLLRANLISHTELELKQFYGTIQQNTKIDEKLRFVFDDELEKVHAQVLYILDTIVEFNYEKADDAKLLQEMIGARIDIEEEVLFPIYKKYCS